MAVELTYRKFPKIYRLEQEEANSKHEGVASLLEQNKAGNYYVATEKIDGANSCIEVLKRDGKLTLQFIHIVKDLVRTILCEAFTNTHKRS